MTKVDVTSSDPYIKIIYAKTDTLIKNLLEAEVAESISISKIVNLALEYHAVTGAFIQLGTVSAEDEHPTKLRKTIYIPKGSDAEKYILSMQDSGKTRKRIICDVIANCVEVGSATKLIDLTEFIIRQNELIKLKQGQTVKAAPLPTPKEIVAETKQQKTEVPTPLEAPAPVITPVITKEDSPKSNPPKKSKRLTFADKFIQSEF